MKQTKFESYLLEMSAQEANLPLRIGDVSFSYSRHFFDRIEERGKLSFSELKKMIIDIRKKLIELPSTGEFLFFSKSLKQGIVATWDSFKSKMSFLTFLPPKNNVKDYFVKKNTEKVVIESHTYDVKIIYID